MTYVTVATDLVGAAVGELTRIGSEVTAATAAAAPTIELAPAGADELSAAVAALFGRYGRAYRAVGAQAAAFHRRFVQALAASAGSYAGAEVANASLLHTVDRPVLGWVNARSQSLFGHPLLGTPNAGASAGTNASAPQALGANPTTTSDTGGIALVMGPTGIPQPSAAYVATVERLCFSPSASTATRNRSTHRSWGTTPTPTCPWT